VKLIVNLRRIPKFDYQVKLESYHMFNLRATFSWMFFYANILTLTKTLEWKGKRKFNYPNNCHVFSGNFMTNKWFKFRKIHLNFPWRIQSGILLIKQLKNKKKINFYNGFCKYSSVLFLINFTNKNRLLSSWKKISLFLLKRFYYVSEQGGGGGKSF